jgi:hypothetical protein
MHDISKTRSASIISPPSNAAAVLPDDGVDLPSVSRAIYVGTAGDVAVITENGQNVIYKNLSGTKVLRARRLLATGTTATDLIVEW